MGSQVEIDNNSSSSGDWKSKLVLKVKATSEVRKAFDELISEESFLVSSEVILKHMSTSLMPSEEDQEDLAEVVVYIIKRLISSLASKRTSIRQGSYTILQVMLQLYPQILPFTISYIEEFFNKNTHSMDNKVDYVMGHILALGAIIRSGCAMEDVSHVQNIVQNLLNLKDTKFSKGPVAGQFLVDLLSMYKEENIALIIWKEAKDLLQAEVESLSPSSLWLRNILARDEYLKTLPEVDSDFQRKTYDQSTFVFMASVFKKLYHERVSITPMLEDYFKSLLLYCETCDGEENLASFFSVAVTPTLNATLPKSNVFAFNITQVALSYLKFKKHVETVLSPELMEMLVVASTSIIDAVNASARGLMSAILQLLIRNKESGSKIQLAILKRLVSTSANFNFDSVTKTTVLQQAGEHLAADTVVCFAKLLNKQLETLYLDEELENSHNFSNLLACCQWTCRLVCHSSMTGFDHHIWKADQVSQLFKLSFFKKLTMKKRQQIKDFYFKALNQTTSNIEWQALFVEHIVEKARSLLNNSDEGGLSNDDKELFLSTYQRMKELKTNVLTSSDLAIFKILYGHLSLHIFIDSKNSKELIEEMNQCFKKALKTKKKKGKKQSSTGSKGGDEPQWIEVVVDLLLSIISNGENFWRKIVSVIFKHICHSLNPNSLSLLTDIINPEIGEDILETEAEMGDVSMEEEHVGDESIEEEEIDEEEEEEDEDSEDSDDDEEDMEDDGDEDQKNIMNLKKKMQAIVGLPMESVEIDSVPQEELVNLDRQLSAVIGKYIALKKRKKAKKARLDKDLTALMCFRTRVCDLLETLIREAPSLDHILALITPIMLAINKALEDPLQKHLLGRLKSLVAEIVKVKKFTKPASVTAEGLAVYLKKFFEFGSKLSNKMKPEISSCCIFLVRSGLHLTSEENQADSDTVMKAYTEYLETALKEMNIEIVDGPIHLETGSIRIVLKKLLETVFKNGIRPFKKKKGIEMIKQIFSNEKALKKIPFSELGPLLQTLRMEVVNAFDYVKQAKHVQSNYLILLLELLRTLKKILKSNPDWNREFGWDQVISSLSLFIQRIPLYDFKALKKMLASVGNIIGVEIASHDDAETKTSNATEGENSPKKSKKKRKLDQSMDTEDTPAPALEPTSVGEVVSEASTNPEGKGEKRKKDKKTKSKKRLKQDIEENTLNQNVENEKSSKDPEEETSKPKKKKKKRNHEERRKKDSARLWMNEEIKDFCFADIRGDVNLN